MIEYLNLRKINAPYEEQIKKALSDVVDSGWYLLGEQNKAFEAEWAAYCGTSHCVACSNGLDALRLVLRAWIEMKRISVGDEVIVPANTYIATILAVTDNGLKPVMVEPDADTYLIDTTKIEQAITPRTRVILPVHLYGQRCNMTDIMSIAKRRDLLVLEDCAQSHGVRPSLGDAQAYSFYPGKNLGALGDAGAVCTMDAELAKVVRSLCFYGSSVKYVNDYQGLNCRMDEMQAAVLRIKLCDLDNCNLRRRQIAAVFDSSITNPLVKLPKRAADHVYHIYPVLCDHRDALKSHLESCGIQTQIHYPIPPFKQQAYKELSGLEMPISQRIAETELSLPCNQSMTDADVSAVVAAVNSFAL